MAVGLEVKPAPLVYLKVVLNVQVQFETCRSEGTQIAVVFTLSYLNG